jgi:cation/acetate symporter
MRLLPAGVPRLLAILFAAFLGGLLSLERLGVAPDSLRFAAIVGALALFVAVGLLAHTIRVPDYYVGGRAISAAIGGAAAAAGGFLGAAFIGVSGVYYAFAQDGLWMIAALVLAALAVFGLLGPALRRLGVTSVPDFLAARFGGHFMRLLAGVVLGLSAFAILVALLGEATRFATLFSGFDAEATMAGLGVLLVLACIPGGALSATATQVAQYAVSVGAYLIALAWLAFPAIAEAPAPATELSIAAAAASAIAPLAERFAGSSGLDEAMIVLALATGLVMSPFLMPKALSAATPGRVPVMGGYAIFYLVLPAALLPLLILAAGLLGIAVDGGDVAPTFTRLRDMPAAFAGLAVAAVLALYLAAASAALLAAASSLSHDLVDRVLMKRTPESRRLFIARILLALIALGACRTALAVDIDPLDMIGVALAFSAALLPSLLLGLWWRRANTVGAFMGIVAGLTVTSWSLAASLLGVMAPAVLVLGGDGLALVETAILGVPLGLAVTVAFSLMTDEPKPRTQEFIDEIDRPRRDILFKERPA